ncbi:MAG TPA: type II/IV secretion system ATPase subunit, partial [Candidatus Thermoplasmatota archaeon]|nr:type II/IV secretion system ATPase subunit [Candidatus Thermoplasmatota archaeon]
MTEPEQQTRGNAKPKGLLTRMRDAFRATSAVPEAAPLVEVVAPTPAIPDGLVEVESRALVAPYCRMRILRDPMLHEHRYEVLEPPLDAREAAAVVFVREAFLRTVDVDLDGPSARAPLRTALDRTLRDYAVDLGPVSRARVLYRLERDFLGHGPIEAFLHDPDIEDISCDGPGIPVYVYHRRHESVRTNVAFATAQELDTFVMELIQRCGKQISVTEPLAEAALPDGSRVQASLSSEITTRGSTFTIRKFRDDPLTPVDLLDNGTASASMLAYLWLAVETGASGIVCGGTASGKTTSLNAFSLFIPPQTKIVSIEDTREINLPHENWIPGLTRGGASPEKQRGEVDMFDLLRAALRQRPEFILVGEIRGREAYVLFQAMATGHTVYSTMHADSASSAVYRLESRPIELPRVLLGALDFLAIQAQVRVAGRRVRRITEIVEITGIDTRTGEIITNTVYRWDPGTDTFVDARQSHVLEKA